jgi:carbonic anhydrase
MNTIQSDLFMDRLRSRGIEEKTIHEITQRGVNVEKWLHGFESVEESVRESVEMVRNHPLIPVDVYVHGLVIDPHTGKLEVVTNGYEWVPRIEE